MTKVEWIAAGVLLLPSSAGLVNDQKGGVEFETFPANGEQGPPWPIKNFQSRASVKFFYLSRPLFWPSSIFAFQQNSNPSRDLVPFKNLWINLREVWRQIPQIFLVSYCKGSVFWLPPRKSMFTPPSTSNSLIFKDRHGPLAMTTELIFLEKINL
jgi:hypothetical protein